LRRVLLSLLHDYAFGGVISSMKKQVRDLRSFANQSFNHKIKTQWNISKEKFQNINTFFALVFQITIVPDHFYQSPVGLAIATLSRSRPFRESVFNRLTRSVACHAYQDSSLLFRQRLPILILAICRCSLSALFFFGWHYHLTRCSLVVYRVVKPSGCHFEKTRSNFRCLLIEYPSRRRFLDWQRLPVRGSDDRGVKIDPMRNPDSRWRTKNRSDRPVQDWERSRARGTCVCIELPRLVCLYWEQQATQLVPGRPYRDSDTPPVCPTTRISRPIPLVAVKHPANPDRSNLGASAMCHGYAQVIWNVFQR